MDEGSATSSTTGLAAKSTTSLASTGEAVRFITPPRSRRQRLSSIIILAVSVVASFIGGLLVVFLNPGKAPIANIPFFASLVLGAFLYWTWRYYGRSPWLATLTIAPRGHAQRMRDTHVPPEKLKPWKPGAQLVAFWYCNRFKIGLAQQKRQSPDSMTARAGLVSGADARTLAIEVPASPDLFRASQRARKIIRDALGDDATPAEDVRAISHCPECGYGLRGNAAAEHAGEQGGHCPECGWAWQAGDIVVFGSLAPGSSGAKQPRGTAGGKIVGLILLLTLVPTVGAVSTIVAIAYIWKNYPPTVAVPFMAACIIGGIALATWGIMRSAGIGLSQRERDDKKAADRLLPSGLVVMRLTRDGFLQHAGTRREAKLWPWDKPLIWKIHHWPSGVVVDARKPCRWYTLATVPHIRFVLDTANARDTVRLLRRTIRANLVAAGKGGTA